MTDSAPAPDRPSAEPAGPRGSNQTRVRDWNERLVLTLLRGQGALSKAEIARQTGLSAQTVSVIMRALEADGLLSRGDPVRGKVGQPSIPMSLVAEGAFFLGLKIGRRSSEMVLVDFHGALCGRRLRRHDWPMPDDAIDFAGRASAELIGQLSPDLRARVAGMGVATPFRLWDWAEAVGAPQEQMDQWRGRDLRADLAARHPFPVFLENDATAACGAELIFGTTPLPADFVHVYAGFFVGGGIVLNGSLLPGRTGNAGALGSMPVRAADGRVVQLIDVASVALLEKAVSAAGLSPDLIWATPEHWPIPEGLLAPWIDGAAEGLAQAAVAAMSVIDFQAMVIDGWMPPAVRRRLVEATAQALRRQTLAGIEPLAVIEGSIGADARALGAAALPLTDRYLIEGSGRAPG